MKSGDYTHYDPRHDLPGRVLSVIGMLRQLGLGLPRFCHWELRGTAGANES
jgi:hypothetical protein